MTINLKSPIIILRVFLIQYCDIFLQLQACYHYQYKTKNNEAKIWSNRSFESLKALHS